MPVAKRRLKGDEVVTVIACRRELTCPQDSFPCRAFHSLGPKPKPDCAKPSMTCFRMQAKGQAVA
jgi:hypothetical protein